MSTISETTFNNFKVFNLNNNHTFFHISISDKNFYTNLFDFFLSEDNLLKYAENNSSLKFNPTPLNYATLFKSLYVFIDDEHINIEYDEKLKEIVFEEFDTFIDPKTGKTIIRLSKIGRLGEYFFHVLLSNYFNFECIFPKISLTTDKNMSIHGIDAIFYDDNQKLLLFGESKVSIRLSNGIQMINNSLEKYEDEIEEEFKLILSNRNLKKNDINIKLQEGIDVCLTFKQFISTLDVKKIGIPIFICHGEDLDERKVLSDLEKNLTKKKIFNLETIYFVITLPIISKDDFFIELKNEISKKMKLYADATK